MKTLKSNISEVYNVQVDCLKIQGFFSSEKWSRMYCSEYFNVFEYLVWSSHGIKKIGGMLAKPASTKGINITSETLHLVTNVHEDDNFSMLVPGKKDYVSVIKWVHNQKLCNL